jgi:hypothetical protein
MSEEDIGAQISAGFQLVIGNANKNQDKLDRYMAQAARNNAMPTLGREVKTGTVNATGSAFIDIVAPPSGSLIMIHSIVVAGLTPVTTVAGEAYIYIVGASFGTLYETPASLGSGDLRDYTASLPSVAFYGREQLTLRNPEKLIVVLNGCTAGQVIVATASFTMISDGVYRQGYSF